MLLVLCQLKLQQKGGNGGWQEEKGTVYGKGPGRDADPSRTVPTWLRCSDLRSISVANIITVHLDLYSRCDSLVLVRPGQPLLLVSLACGGGVVLAYRVYQELGYSDRMRGDSAMCLYPRGSGRGADSILHAVEGSAAGGSDDIAAV